MISYAVGVVTNDGRKLSYPYIYNGTSWEPAVPYAYYQENNVTNWTIIDTRDPTLVTWLESTGKEMMDSNGKYIGLQEEIV